MNFTSLPTPAVLIDHARVLRNIDSMQSAAGARGKRLRPHAKTHKSPDLAKIQIARGASGVCCAKLGEAEVFAAHGIQDIRLPYPLNPVNGDRVLALLDRTRLSFIVDHLDVARGWSAVMKAAGRSVDVLAKVDVGLHRCGIDPDPETASAFAAEVAGMPGLTFRGLLSHAGHAYGATSADQIAAIAREEAEMLTAIRERLAQRGVPVEEISVGATPSARASATLPGITELRPGNYIYYDRMQVNLGSAAWEDCALSVLARVVSRPAADRLILDSGSKTLSNDQVRGGAVPGFGAVMQGLEVVAPDERLTIERLSEEHATVRVHGESPLQPGDLVRIVPNHSCVVSNLVDAVWVLNGEGVAERLDVAARGCIA